MDMEILFVVVDGITTRVLAGFPDIWSAGKYRDLIGGGAVIRPSNTYQIRNAS